MTRTDKLNRLLFTMLSLYLTVLLLMYPPLSLEYASAGLRLWLTKMVPVLLPFMILSGIMIRMDLTENFVRLVHPLLHLLYGTSKNGSYTIVMGFLCGFPMGARIIGELYGSGRLSKEESARLLCFCNNIGPLYFLSYVAPTLDIRHPLIPFLIMYGIPLLYGIALMRIVPIKRRTGSALSDLKEDGRPDRMTLPAAIDASVVSGLIGIARLGGYMIFFNLLNIAFVPFRHTDAALLKIYRCILEITSGIDYSGQSLFYPILILLPFGGLSCIAQTYSMICHTDLPLKPYVLHKVIQTLLTALCYLVLYLN